MGRFGLRIRANINYANLKECPGSHFGERSSKKSGQGGVSRRTLTREEPDRGGTRSVGETIGRKLSCSKRRELGN